MHELKLVAGTALLVLAFYGGYWLRGSLSAPELTTYAPEVLQGDGSVILEREADPRPSPAPHALPAGAIEERRVAVTVQPRPVVTSAQGAPAACDCGPVTVDLSLVRDGSGRRVIASSADGIVIGGRDMPIVELEVPRSFHWAAGVSYDPFGESPGIWVERDLGRFRVGADLYQDRAGLSLGMAARLRAGWVF